jgi:hypothetical protein
LSKVKPKKPKRTVTKTIIEEIPEDGLDYVEREETMPANFYDAASQWVNTISGRDDTYSVTLYQYEQKSGNKKALCGSWEDEIPTINDIGMMYGSGRYRMYITFPGNEDRKHNKINSYVFYIHAHYDKLRQKPINNVPAIGSMGFDQAAGMDSAFQMFQKVFAMILPIMSMGKQEQSPPMQEMLVENYRTMNEVMKANFLDQQKMYVDLMRDRADLGEVEPAETEETGMSALLKTALPIIEGMFPNLKGNEQADIDIQNQVKQNPQFQALLKNRGDFQKVITHLDKSYGKKEVNQMLKNLEIPRGK